MVPPRSVWDGVLHRLGSELPDYALDAWLRSLTPRDEGGQLRLLAKSRFHCERVRQSYLDAIRRCAEAEAGRALRVSVEVQSAAESSPAAPETGPEPEAIEASPAPPPRRRAVRGAEQRALPYSFETFVVGPANALAREASLALARGRQPAVSPLFVAGGTGLGKTHLAYALAAEARRLPGRRVRHLSAESFTSQFLSSLRSRSIGSFKRRYREECDLLVVEDVQFLGGKQSTQLELFHTLEHLRSVGASVVLTGDRLPREISSIETRLRSQMGSGLVAEIEPPDAALRRSILRAKAAAGGVRVPADCLDRLVEAVRGSVRDLESALIQVVQRALLLKQPIDLELTETALRKVVDTAASGRRLGPREVIETVAAFYGSSPEALASRSRRRDVLVPRQIAMYLCRRFSEASLAEIGAALGRDHPAVRNAIDVVERAILERAPLRYRVEELASRLEALAARRGCSGDREEGRSSAPGG